MAKIVTKLAERARSEGMEVMAESRLKQAMSLINEGLELDPGNAQLLSQRDSMGVT